MKGRNNVKLNRLIWWKARIEEKSRQEIRYVYRGKSESDAQAVWKVERETER